MVGLIVGKWQQPPGVKTLFCHSSISPARGGTDFFITDRVWISSVRTLDFPEISFGFVELNFWICRPACFERIQGRVGARPSMVRRRKRRRRRRRRHRLAKASEIYFQQNPLWQALWSARKSFISGAGMRNVQWLKPVRLA